MRFMIAAIAGTLLTFTYAAQAQTASPGSAQDLSAFNLQEKEDIQYTEDAAQKSAAAVQAACGNAAFSFKYDWAAYTTIDYSLAAQGPNVKRNEILHMAAMFSDDLSKTLVKMCGADAMAKAEIAKLSEIDLEPRKDKSGGFGMKFVKAGAALQTSYYPFARSGSQDVPKDLKAAL